MDELIRSLNKKRNQLTFFLILLILSMFAPLSALFFEAFIESYPWVFVSLIIGIPILATILFLIPLVGYQKYKRTHLYPFIIQGLWNYQLNSNSRTLVDWPEKQIVPWRIKPKCDHSFSTLVGTSTATWFSNTIIVSNGKSSTTLFRGLVLEFPFANPGYQYARVDHPLSRLGSKKFHLPLEQVSFSMSISHSTPDWESIIPNFNSYQRRQYRKVLQRVKQENQLSLIYQTLETNAMNKKQETAMKDLYERVYQVIPSPALSLAWSQNNLYVIFNDGINPLNIEKFKKIVAEDIESSQAYLNRLDEVVQLVYKWSKG